jgi:hypothetical protein
MAPASDSRADGFCVTFDNSVNIGRPKGQFIEAANVINSNPARVVSINRSSLEAGCIIVTDEPHNVGDPVSSGVISIKSMEGLPARAEIDAHCCRATRRRGEIKSSIRRRDRRRIIREWALHHLSALEPKFL